jgi:hypothetical protein
VATRLEADEVKIILIEKGAFDEMFYGRRQ